MDVFNPHKIAQAAQYVNMDSVYKEMVSVKIAKALIKIASIVHT